MSLMPEGVKVYYGDSLKKKIAIENKLKNIFEKSCYNYVELPIYEFYEDLKDNFSESLKNQMFKFVDRDSGKVVTLRPDMTSLLAKLVKLEKDEIEESKRIYYVGNVFRYDKMKSGVYRERSQAGIELIRGDRFKADLEVMIIAIEVMRSLGLKNPKIEIGDINIFNTVTEKMNLSREEVLVIKDLFAKKDIPTLEALVKEKNYDEILLKLPLMIGKKEILGELEIPEMTYLKKLLTALDDLGYSNNYILDLGIVKEMEYYTGIVFNGFSDETGDFILNGGRYDKLMGVNALGFVVNVDAVVELVQNIELEDEKSYYIIGNDYKKALNLKKDYVLKDKKAEISFKENESLEEAKKYALKNKFKYIVNVDNDEKVEL